MVLGINLLFEQRGEMFALINPATKSPIAHYTRETIDALFEKYGMAEYLPR
jgi:hypothetical protein